MCACSVKPSPYLHSVQVWWMSPSLTRYRSTCAVSVKGREFTIPAQCGQVWSPMGANLAYLGELTSVLIPRGGTDTGKHCRYR